MTQFWVNDFSELYKNKNYFNIIPNSNMSYIELLNTTSRLLILSFIILILFAPLYALFPLFFLLYIVIYYFSEENKFETFVNSFDEDFRKKHYLQIVDNYYNKKPFTDNLDSLYSSNMSNSLDSLNSLNSLNSLSLENISNKSCKSNKTNISSENNKLFKDNSVLFTENNAHRNSSENITYDLGNTTDFANNLYNPVPTCKEKTLNCYNYENLKHKR